MENLQKRNGNGMGRAKSKFGYEVSAKVGLRLKKIRLDRDLTAREVCEQIGISSNSLFAYENGTRRITLDALKLIADSYGVAISDLLKKV